MTTARVESVLNLIQSLKPMPSSVTRVLKELDDPHVTAGVISDYIGLDQALAALVLQMANSVVLGYARTCTSLNDAVMRLGFKRLKSILLASTASGALTRKLSGYRQGAGELWQHSLAIAVSAEWVAQTLHYPDPEEAYVSGLLHDMGKLLLDQFVLADYNKVMELIEKYHYPLWKVEETLIGIDHAGVGGMVAERWHFPTLLVDTIRFHHAPHQASQTRLPAIINLANHLGTRPDKATQGLFSSELHPETPRILKLSADDVKGFSRLLQAKLEIAVPQS